ncbi:hypothetical protein [Nannocystis pusilla]|uniref:hypothetical protein n=1 Tax=Nannocystis pusilla TaxID=889268 RepID=UPI003B7D8734
MAATAAVRGGFSPSGTAGGAPPANAPWTIAPAASDSHTRPRSSTRYCSRGPPCSTARPGPNLRPRSVRPTLKRGATWPSTPTFQSAYS